MSKCKWNECENDARTKSDFCSDKCSKRYRRATRTESDTNPDKVSDLTNPDTEPGRGLSGQSIEMAVNLEALRPATLADYQDPDGRQYATRAEPDRLNWGQWMNSDQLKQAGLKANRMTTPGDWDYAGVCEQVDGVWQVKKAS